VAGGAAVAGTGRLNEFSKLTDQTRAEGVKNLLLTHLQAAANKRVRAGSVTGLVIENRQPDRAEPIDGLLTMAGDETGFRGRTGSARGAVLIKAEGASVQHGSVS
jgi:hypothetical protein